MEIMDEQKLLDIIRQAKLTGQSDDQIQAALVDQGYAESDIRQFLDQLAYMRPADGSQLDGLHRETGVIQQPRSKHWIKRILLSLVGVFILLVGGIIVLQYMRYHHNQEIVTRQVAAIKSEIIMPRQKALKALANETSWQEPSLRALGLVDKKIAESEVDVCYLSSSGGGFIIQSYKQRCYLRYVQGYTTQRSEAEVRQVIDQSVSLSDGAHSITEESLFGKAAASYGKTESGSWCILSELNKAQDIYHKEVLYRQANMDRDASGVECSIPRPFDGMFSTYNLAVDLSNNNNGLSVKTVTGGYEVENIDISSSQIWIAIDDEYYSKDIGCKPEMFGFMCQKPLDGPVHPDLDN